MSVVIGSREANIAAAVPLSVFADLRFDTDGHRLHLVGDGQSLVVHSSDPRKLLKDVRQLSLPAQTSGLTGRTALGRAADGLREVGLRVDVRGPDGVLVRLGDGPDSTFGRFVTGSSAVTFGSVRAVATAFTLRLPVRALALGVAAVAIAVGAGVLRRRAR